MYNEEQKQLFMSQMLTGKSMLSQAQSMFNSFAPYEEERGSDLCTWSVDELGPALANAFGIRESSRHAAYSILRKYAQWCMDNGVPGATDSAMKIGNVGSSALDKLRRNSVRNPRDLQAWLDTFLDKESEETSDNYLRAFCWMAYSGLEDSDAYVVRASDVDYKHMVIRTAKREYPIYKEALPCLHNCTDLTQFAYKHPLYSNVIYRARIPGDDIMRGVRGKQTLENIRVTLSKKNKTAIDAGKTDRKLSYRRIWISGIFYRMLKDEIEGFPVDFRDVAELGIMEKQFDMSSCRNTLGYRRREAAAAYKTDYELWKRTLL